MEELIRLLDEAMADETVTTVESEGERFIAPHHILAKIEAVCDVIDFDERGVVAYESQIQLIEAGYNVVAGEQDSFGWLSACLSTKKGYYMIW